MKPVRFCVSADWHFTLREPESRASGYGAGILAKLAFLDKTARKHKVKAHLVAGDLFHGKGEVTQREVQALARTLRKFKRPVHSIWGNHDANCATMVGYRAYGTLVQAGLITDVDLEIRPKPVDVDGVVVCGWGYRGSVDGPDKRYYSLPRDLQGNPSVLLAHGYLIATEQALPFDHTRLSELNGSGASALVCGHYHTPQMEAQLGATLVVLPGGVSRTTRPEEDRKGYCAILEVDETTARVVEWIELPYRADAFLPVAEAGATCGDAHEVAQRLVVAGANLSERAMRAVEEAGARLKAGPEVVAEAKRRLVMAREETV